VKDWILRHNPRSKHPAVKYKLARAHQRLLPLAISPLVTDGKMESELAAIVADLIEVERYLQDPSMDWKGGDPDA
jgi:hypothetical protein